MLRTAPCFLSSELQAYDDLLRSVTSSITNISFQDSDPAWTQASLPVKHGGRCAVQFAPSAFLASAAGSSCLVFQIIPTHLQHAPLVARADTLSRWSPGHNNPPLTDSASHSQREWDSPRIKATAQPLLKDVADERSTSRKESGAWLNTLPVAALGVHMDDETIHITMDLRLGVPLCSLHECGYCGTTVDNLATHGLSCHLSEGRHPCRLGSTQPRLGHWATPVPGNRGGTQQGVYPPKNRHRSTEGGCGSSARDCRGL